MESQRFLQAAIEGMGLLTREQIERALEEQRVSGERLVDILVRLGYIRSEDLTHSLTIQLGLVPVKLSAFRIDDDLINKVPASIAKQHKLIPIKMENNTLTVAVANPLDLLGLQNLSAMLGCKVRGEVTTEDDVDAALQRYYGVEEETIDSMLQELSEQDISYVGGEEEISVEEEIADEAPVIKLVSLLILEAFKARASDIHIEPLERKFRIRYRIDGVLHEIPGPPKRLEHSVISRIKIMSGMDIAEKRLPQDGRIMINLLGKQLDLRVSSLPGIHGESVVLRILDKSSLLLGLEELGFLEEDKKKFEEIIARPHGIILVTGPTGSGKTTTLYAVLNQLNQPDRKLITVEDPVEYQLAGINQVQIKPQIGLTFATCLRHMLRQAPDIIMVGEIRDTETAEIAVRAALTGHLVFSTLHTNDAPGAVTRLIDMGIKPFLVASSVQAVMAQRLVRTICPHCKEPYNPPEELVQEMSRYVKDISKVTFYRGKGCEQCRQTGYRGRIGIFEIMEVTSKLQKRIVDRSPTSVIREEARREGMGTLRDDGWKKVMLGITTLEEVARVTRREEESLDY